jgi:sulfate adenylyltransferase/3'-phosphoadenosine 5'-phosphosulfate synthase
MPEEGRGFIIWLTGLSGAGKSTIAERVRVELGQRGRPAEVLDGDEIRTHLSKGLGFSREDRDTNIARIGYVARLVARNGGIAITAAISPYGAARDEVRAQAGGFLEVYVRCSLDALIRRDVKGLYQRALAGEIDHFTGISDPYEPPLRPEVVVDTDQEGVQESVDKIISALERLGYLPAPARERLLSGEELEAGLAEAGGLPRLDVGKREAADIYMLSAGALSPLHGFVGEQDYATVLEQGRLRSGQPFPIPVTLRIDDDQARRLGGADRVALWAAGVPVGLLDVEGGVFRAPHRPEALAVYGTEDLAHPGVRALYDSGELAMAGPVTGLGRPAASFPAYDLTPREVRARKAELGWRTMVGFQTRNPVHRAHEYLQKVALEIVDGLLLHPLVGETKADDIPAEVRIRCYEALLEEYFPADRVLLATNPAWMRYAGPREAVFHAIVRRNYGCTHFIVGRDHAGVGSYYDTYAAHRIFDQYRPAELGIEILRFEHTFYCTVCGGMASTRTCPHPSSAHLALSGSRVRELLKRGEPLPAEFTRPEISEILVESTEPEPARAAG